MATRCVRLFGLLITVMGVAVAPEGVAQEFRWPPMRTAAETPSHPQAARPYDETDAAPSENDRTRPSGVFTAPPAPDPVTRAAYAEAAPPKADGLAASPAGADSPELAAPEWPVGRSRPTSPASGPGVVDWKILENRNGKHLALVFDPIRRVFAVYQVDAESGEIMLRSVRNLTADLSLPQYNSSNPAPRDIQVMLDEARQ
ncbi:hypothetical protein [Botrimarina sp.]|uniref:hypothetical protein n=1 Tax=Botrimarina sp. TaxID=2795802 RepID=UPI0032ED0B52